MHNIWQGRREAQFGGILKAAGHLERGQKPRRAAGKSRNMCFGAGWVHRCGGKLLRKVLEVPRIQRSTFMICDGEVIFRKKSSTVSRYLPFCFAKENMWWGMQIPEYHKVAEERIVVGGGVVRGKVGRSPGAGGKATKLRPPLRRGGRK